MKQLEISEKRMVQLTKTDNYFCEVIDENDRYVLVVTPRGSFICWRKPVFKSTQNNAKP